MALFVPEICHRGRDDCSSLAFIKSDNGSSLVCCGHNTPENREWKEDKFRVCWKNDRVDEIGDYDYADMKDTMSVLAQALSADEHMSRVDKLED
jgi:hypothetical protein